MTKENEEPKTHWYHCTDCDYKVCATEKPDYPCPKCGSKP